MKISHSLFSAPRINFLPTAYVLDLLCLLVFIPTLALAASIYLLAPLSLCRITLSNQSYIYTHELNGQAIKGSGADGSALKSQTREYSENRAREELDRPEIQAGYSEEPLFTG